VIISHFVFFPGPIITVDRAVGGQVPDEDILVTVFPAGYQENNDCGKRKSQSSPE
jgi:hypothetical protein